MWSLEKWYRWSYLQNRILEIPGEESLYAIHNYYIKTLPYTTDLGLIETILYEFLWPYQISLVLMKCQSSFFHGHQKNKILMSTNTHTNKYSDKTVTKWLRKLAEGEASWSEHYRKCRICTEVAGGYLRQ